MTEFPVLPKPASTVVLARDGSRGPEVLLLRRPDRGFAAGAWVFPGGAVDVDDYRLKPASTEERTSWATVMRMREPAAAWAHVVAGVRETWEETGHLLGEVDASAERLERARSRAGGTVDSFSALVPSLRLGPDAMVYLSRWITPEAESRRYDTRFFVARVAPGVEVSPAIEEVEEALWIAPGEAVRRGETGELRLMLPTRHTLATLLQYATAGEMLARLRAATPPAYLPRMRTTPKGVIIDVHPLDRADEP